MTTLAAVFYWKGPVRPIKRGTPLQLDVVEDKVWHEIIWKEPSGQLSLGPFRKVDNFEAPSLHQFLLKSFRLKVSLVRTCSGRYMLSLARFLYFATFASGGGGATPPGV